MPAKLAPGIRQRRPGYFEVRVYAGVDHDTGRSRYVTRSVRGSVKDANDLRARLMGDVAANGAPRPGQRTLAELFDAVLEHLEVLGREPTTLHGYRRLTARINEGLGKMPLRKLSASDLDRLYAKLMRKGASAATVRRYHAWIHRCLSQALKWEWVTDNVARRASPPPEPRRQATVQTEEAVARLIAVADSSRQPELGLAFRLLASSGGRRGEVCGLQWRDIDFESGLCTISRAVKQIPGSPLIVGDAKNHQRRTIQLDAGTLAVLAEHRARLEERAALAATSVADEAFILSDHLRCEEPWRPERLSQALARLRQRAGYTGRLHDLRHWHASYLLGEGEAAVVVAERLGHRDPSTTHRWYAHAMPRSDRRAADLIDRALSPKARRA